MMTGKCMSTRGLAYRLIVLVVMGTCGCARLQRDAVESGETKVQLTSQTGWRDTFQVSKADLAPDWKQSIPHRPTWTRAQAGSWQRAVDHFHC